MFILDLIVYLAVGFLVAYVLVKYKISMFPEDKKYFTPLSRGEIKTTIVFWPLILGMIVGIYFFYYITLPIRLGFNFLIDITFKRTK